MKKYQINTPLHLDAKKKPLAQGSVVELDEDQAAPLVSCGAIAPAAEPADKAKGKKAE